MSRPRLAGCALLQLESGTVGTAGLRPPLATVIEAFGASGLRCLFGPRLEKLDGGLVTPPGFDSDLIVRADLRLFYRFWLGHVEQTWLFAMDSWSSTGCLLLRSVPD